MTARRSAPLSPGETTWITVALSSLVMATALALTGGGFEALVVRETPAKHPVPTALPDLCEVFPKTAAGLTLEARPGTRTLDRSEAYCFFRTSTEGGSVSLRAGRPEPGYDRDTFANRAKAAHRQYLPSSAEASASPVGGLGDEARMSVDTSADSREASLVARDGIMIIHVDYRAPDSGDVQVVTRQLAAELLKVLPPDGK